MKLIVQLAGGLGNQLFQYAMGRALSLRHGAEFCLDTRTGFVVDHRYQRSMELDAFRIPASVHRSTPSDVHVLLNRMRHHLHSRGLPVPGYVQETPASALASPWRGTRRYLGYWQSERWFADQADAIRNDLEFARELPLSLTEWEQRLKAASSVAVHVRRVQYARKLPLAYYERALENVKASVPNPDIYYFSDDPDWCEGQLQPKFGGQVVRHPESDALCDFRLMAACRHFVIANSTFSWWAAWLGEKEHTRVFAPAQPAWDHPDILPRRWDPVPVQCEMEGSV